MILARLQFLSQWLCRLPDSPRPWSDTKPLPRCRARQLSKMRRCVSLLEPSLLLRIRTAAFESFPARQGHGPAIGGHRTPKLRTEAGNDNLESGGNRVSLPSESEQRVGRAEFKAPVGDFAVGFGDVDTKPGVRIDEVELR